MRKDNRTGLHRFKAASGFALLLVTSVMPQFGQTKSEQYSEFISTFRNEAKSAGIVGGSFVFLKHNKIVASEYYG